MSTDGASLERIEPRQLGIGALFDTVRDAVVVGEARSGRIVLWNEAAERLFGYSRSEAFGLLIEDLMPEEYKRKHRAGIALFAQTGRGALVDSSDVIELPAVHKDGRVFTIELTLTPVEHRRGPYVLAILRDVTERRQMQRALEETDELRRACLEMVAHDVRSPMATILGYAALLRDDVLTDQQRSDALSAIGRSATRVSRLAEEVLVAAALETGSVPVRIEPTDLAVALRFAAEAVRGVYPDVDLAIDVPSGVHVAADRERLAQVLTNMLSNAASYSPPDGRVDAAAVIRGADVVISVRDFGPGIDPEARSKLFQRFSTTERDGRRGLSVGLGLFVCKQLMHLMSGEISITDTDGPGATFVLVLPRAERQ